ncbi:MAG: hypothetical protein LBQ75_05170 [Zoogloeaceae bacterium]|jgi:hypothetical protein|nr:hypothetical protein [Zoogloeaceae bacterium]
MELKAWEQARFDDLTEQSRNILSELNEINNLLDQVPEGNVIERSSLESRYMSVSMELTPVLMELNQLKKKQAAETPRTEQYEVARRGGLFFVNEERVWTYAEITAQAEKLISGSPNAENSTGAFDLWKQLTTDFQKKGDYERICELIGTEKR